MIDLLKRKGLLAFPTDTVFGLACIVDKEAIEKVYEAKGRTYDKPLPMMCDSLEMIRKNAYVSDEAEKIIEKFVPGALTLVMKKREEVPDYVTMNKATIGIRVPDDDFILDLISKLGKPLMVSSANISGDGSLLKWEDVWTAMNGKIDGIVCEDARGDSASTIIDLSGEKIHVLREGPISITEIMEALQ